MRRAAVRGLPRPGRSDLLLRARGRGLSVQQRGLLPGSRSRADVAGAHVSSGDQLTLLDENRARQWASMLSPRATRIDTLIVIGEPPSKARPRFWSGKNQQGVYDPSAKRQTALAKELALKIGRLGAFRSNVCVGAIFYRSSRQRIDVDNMLKFVLDAGTEARLWDDDSQVTAVLGMLELDTDTPRTVLLFADHSSTMERGKAFAKRCLTCRVEFTPPHNTSTQRFCSPACVSRSRGQDLSLKIACEECGKDFRRTTKTNRFCGSQCRISWLTARKKAKARPMPNCRDCGQALHRHGQSRCRACWKKAHSAGIA